MVINNKKIQSAEMPTLPRMTLKLWEGRRVAVRLGSWAQPALKPTALAVLMCVMVLASGCASIVSKSEWPVTINSDPSGATFTITDKRGAEIHKAQTPATVVLKAYAGPYDPARYKLIFEKSGYSESTLFLDGKMNEWYMGNILFCGLDLFLGMLVVDPFTGAMWKLDERVYGALAEERAGQSVSAPEPVPARTPLPEPIVQNKKEVDAPVLPAKPKPEAPSVKTEAKPVTAAKAKPFKPGSVFVSDDGKKLEIAVGANERSIEYRLWNGQTGKLDKVSSSSGAKYTDEKMTVWIKGSDVIILDSDDKILFEGAKAP